MMKKEYATNIQYQIPASLADGKSVFSTIRDVLVGSQINPWNSFVRINAVDNKGNTLRKSNVRGLSSLFDLVVCNGFGAQIEK